MNAASVLLGFTVFFLFLGVLCFFNRSVLKERLEKYNQKSHIKLDFWETVLGISKKGYSYEKDVFSAAILTSTIFTVFVYLMLLDAVISLILGIAVFFIFPRLLNYYRTARLRKTFNNNLPRAINSIITALQGGSTMLQGFENAGEELPYPIDELYRQVAEDIENNATVEEAVQRMADKVGTEEAYLLVDCISLINEIGGGNNAINLLESVSDTVRGNEHIAQKIRSNTSHILLGFAGCTLFPFIMMGFMSYAMPEYRLIIMGAKGKIVVAGSIVLLAFGWLIVRNIIKSARNTI